MPEPKNRAPADPDPGPSIQQQRILEAAARLFRDKGYAATSMRDLARLVELKASSLYNHIRSKEDLLQRICFTHAERFVQAMERVEQRDDLDPADQVQELLRTHMELALGEATSVTAFNDEWRHLSEPHLSRFIALRRAYEERFLAIIRAGMERGSIRAMDPRVLLYTLLSSVRWLYDGYRPDRFPDPDRVREEIGHLLRSGLATDSA